MTVGETFRIESTVCPTNATFKNLVWNSDNTEVATVGLQSGVVTAIAAGEANITATSVDGIESNVCRITVEKPKVLIRRDNEGLPEVVLSSEPGQERIWKCIDEDVVFYEYSKNPMDNYEHNKRLERCAMNYYETYINITSKFGRKEYTDDELKLLYFIDPHGVAAYVKAKALSRDYSPDEGLRYKDSMFRTLFNREPIYKKLDESNNWVTIRKDDIVDRDEVMSEAESLFGYHVNWDEGDWQTVAGAVLGIISTVIGIACPLSITAITAINYSIASLFVLYTVATDTINEDIASFFGQQSIEQVTDAQLSDYFKTKKLGWAYDMVGLLWDAKEISEVFNRLIDVPQFDKRLYNCCANIEYCDVFVKLKDEKEYKIKDICTMLEQV